MKKQEFIEKLKSIAKENGFEIRNESAENYELFSVADKKIKWVFEFVKHSPNDEIFKVYGMINDKIFIDPKRECFITEWEPSTQSAYEEQLKRIAKEKFGEIKEGDRINSHEACSEWSNNIEIQKENSLNEWWYDKEDDRLMYHGVLLYQQGKWATKISTPSVLFRENDSSYSSNPVFTFHVRNFKIDYTNGPEIGRHLANEFQKFIINQQNNERQQ